MNIIEKSLKNYFAIQKPGFVYFGHGVVSGEQTPFFPNLHLSVEEFSRVIDFWESLGFKFISLEELSDIVLHKKKMNCPWIHLTFDDGYKNNITTLYPFLKSKNIPATIFISTRHILEKRRFDNYKIACGLKHTNDVDKIQTIANLASVSNMQDKLLLTKEVIRYYKYLPVIDKESFLEVITSLLSTEEWSKYDALYDSEEVMNESEVAELSKDPLIRIEAHGHNHYILSTLDKPHLDIEFGESKRIISQLTGITPITYCYPNGTKSDFTEQIEKVCQENGYKLAFTTVAETVSTNVGHYRVPRIALSSSSLLKKAIKIGLPVSF